jgi:alcohol dehydrogenase (cytochrome c)
VQISSPSSPAFQKSGLKNLKLAFTVALSGFQSGGRYAFGNLEAAPIVEDGIICVPDWR